MLGLPNPFVAGLPEFAGTPFNPLSPSIKMYILLTVVHIFLMVPVGGNLHKHRDIYGW